MNKSFVLKDGEGRLAGYLLQFGDSIRCRVQHDGAAQVTLLFADGSRARRCAENGEMVWRFPDKALCGGFAAGDGQLVASTDEAAAQAFRLESCKKKKAEISSGEKLAGQEKRDLPERRAEMPEKMENHVFPQRRWPPPCCMTARYIGGAWQEKTVDQQEN